MATDVFHRTADAEQMAQQLLQPSPLHMNVRSGVLLSGTRRVGKTTFLRQDLVPAREARGALVVYVDLWADRSKSPATLVLDAVRATLQQVAAFQPLVAHKRGGNGVPLFVFYRSTIWFG